MCAMHLDVMRRCSSIYGIRPDSNCPGNHSDSRVTTEVHELYALCINNTAAQQSYSKQTTATPSCICHRHFKYVGQMR
jgi:hypothetical protein